MLKFAIKNMAVKKLQIVLIVLSIVISAGVGVLAAHDGKYNVIVTISADGEYKEGEGYSVNGRRIAVGEKMALRFPNYVGEGYCIALSVDE